MTETNKTELSSMEHFATREYAKVLKSLDISFSIANNGYCICVREPGKPIVDIYPTKDKWRVLGTGEMIQGNISEFIKWFEDQKRVQPKDRNEPGYAITPRKDRKSWREKLFDHEKLCNEFVRIFTKYKKEEVIKALEDLDDKQDDDMISSNIVFNPIILEILEIVLMCADGDLTGTK